MTPYDSNDNGMKKMACSLHYGKSLSDVYLLCDRILF